MKKGAPILIVVLGGLLLVALFFVVPALSPEPGGEQEEQEEQEEKGRGTQRLVIRADTGFVIDYGEYGDIPEEHVGDRVIYERYRLFTSAADCGVDATCDETEIDLRLDGVSASVTDPNGTESTISKEYAQYLVPISPFAERGLHQLRVSIPDEGIFLGEFSVNVAERPETLIATATADGRNFRFDGLDLSETSLVIYITPSNLMRGLLPDNTGVISVSDDDLTDGGHVFLVKKDNTWHYAVYLVVEGGMTLEEAESIIRGKAGSDVGEGGMTLEEAIKHEERLLSEIRGNAESDTQ